MALNGHYLGNINGPNRPLGGEYQWPLTRNSIRLEAGFNSGGATVSLKAGSASAGSGGASYTGTVYMTYDAGGQRVKYLKGSTSSPLDGSRIYVRGSSGNVLAEYVRSGSSWNLDHYNLYGNGLVGKLDGAGQKFFYIADHLGSIRVTLDQNGNVDSWTDYYPFGKEARGSNTANEPREQFTGKERDSEIGLDYFGARYYNAEIGRWTSVDPLSGKYPSLTPYNYVMGNPLRLADPDGRSGWDMVMAAGSKYINTAYEFGGKNPTYAGTSYSQLPDNVRSQVDKSNAGNTGAYRNYGSDLGSSKVNGYSALKSYGIDCSGFYIAGFNANPDAAFTFNPNSYGANDLALAFASNKGGFVGEDGNDYLKLDTDLNSADVKVGDAVFFSSNNEDVTHVAMVGKIVRDKKGNVTDVYTVEATKPGGDVSIVHRTGAQMKKEGFAGYGVINQKESGSSKALEKLDQ